MATHSPHLTVLDDRDPIQYRCNVCRTHKQRTGKVNFLGKPNLKSWKHFVGQHVNSASHQVNLKALNEQEAINRDHERNGGHDGLCECNGYAISNDTPIGSLKRYHYEFGIYASHANFSTKCARNKYWCTQNPEVWHIQHHKCEGHFKPVRGRTTYCCPHCLEVGSARGAQKNMLRFITKYYAAILLQKRLFATEAELQETIAEILGGAFGQNNQVTFSKIRDLKNAELQEYVRHSFSHMPDEEKTPNMRLFMSTVVEPCLKVNVSSISPVLTNLSAQFVSALATKKLDDAWLFLHFFELVCRNGIVMAWV